MDYLVAHWRDILEIGLSVLGVASAIARITPTDTDNAILDKIYGFIHTLGLTKPTPKP